MAIINYLINSIDAVLAAYILSKTFSVKFMNAATPHMEHDKNNPTGQVVIYVGLQPQPDTVKKASKVHVFTTTENKLGISKPVTGERADVIYHCVTNTSLSALAIDYVLDKNKNQDQQGYDIQEDFMNDFELAVLTKISEIITPFEINYFKDHPNIRSETLLFGVYNLFVSTTDKIEPIKKIVVDGQTVVPVKPATLDDNMIVKQIRKYVSSMEPERYNSVEFKTLSKLSIGGAAEIANVHNHIMKKIEHVHMIECNGIIGAEILVKPTASDRRQSPEFRREYLSKLSLYSAVIRKMFDVEFVLYEQLFTKPGILICQGPDVLKNLNIPEAYGTNDSFTLELCTEKDIIERMEKNREKKKKSQTDEETQETEEEESQTDEETQETEEEKEARLKTERFNAINELISEKKYKLFKKKSRTFSRNGLEQRQIDMQRSESINFSVNLLGVLNSSIEKKTDTIDNENLVLESKMTFAELVAYEKKKLDDEKKKKVKPPNEIIVRGRDIRKNIADKVKAYNEVFEYLVRGRKSLIDPITLTYSGSIRVAETVDDEKEYIKSVVENLGVDSRKKKPAPKADPDINDNTDSDDDKVKGPRKKVVTINKVDRKSLDKFRTMIDDYVNKVLNNKSNSVMTYEPLVKETLVRWLFSLNIPKKEVDDYLNLIYYYVQRDRDLNDVIYTGETIDYIENMEKVERLQNMKRSKVVETQPAKNDKPVVEKEKPDYMNKKRKTTREKKEVTSNDVKDV